MEIVNRQKQVMIYQTISQLLTQYEITVDEFQQLLNIQTKILERVLADSKK